MLVAITRQVSRSMNRCELSFHQREPIDLDRAIHQHSIYEKLLSEAGLHVISLTTDPGLPDCVFVEDPAIVVDELAVISRTGAVSRRREAASLASALGKYRTLKFLAEPATLDGGDVMRIERTLYVGVSRRTNREAITQLSGLLLPYDYEVKAIPVDGCLHLKSACSYIGQNTVLANRQWIDTEQLKTFEILDVPVEEPGAPNALLLEDLVVVPASFPQTRALLRESGFPVRTIDVSELQKAESGVTCMSLIFSHEEPPVVSA